MLSGWAVVVHLTDEETMRSNPIKRCIAAVLCVFGIATAASAATVTLTFDTFDDPLYPASYTQSGFIITSLYPDGGHLHAGDGNLWLHSREGSSPYQLRRIDGGSFDFLGFDYQGGDSLFVSDTGASFTILGDQPLATFTMPAAFHDVTTIDWFMNNPGDLDFPELQWGAIDNVVLNPRRRQCWASAWPRCCCGRAARSAGRLPK
jgi:hypothetical protein